jgi:hypothetical protein
VPSSPERNRPRRGRFVAPGLSHADRPYADWRHFKNGYGYWNYRGGLLLCALLGHKWKWCHSLVRLDDPRGCAPYWHVQCVRCRKSERNPSEDDAYRVAERQRMGTFG